MMRFQKSDCLTAHLTQSLNALHSCLPHPRWGSCFLSTDLLTDRRELQGASERLRKSGKFREAWERSVKLREAQLSLGEVREAQGSSGEAQGKVREAQGSSGKLRETQLSGFRGAP